MNNGQRTMNKQWIIQRLHLARFSFQTACSYLTRKARRYRGGTSCHDITSHVKTGSTCSHGKFSLVAARHATPGKGQPPKLSRQRVMQLYSTDVWQYR